jgi:hypothetical protein
MLVPETIFTTHQNFLLMVLAKHPVKPHQNAL